MAAAPEVRAGQMDTGLLERGLVDAAASEESLRDAAIAAAAIESLALAERHKDGDPWDALSGFRVTGDAGVEWELEPAGSAPVMSVRVLGDLEDAIVRVGGDEQRLAAFDAGDGRARIALNGRARMWDHAVLGQFRWVASGADAFSFKLAELVVEGAGAGSDGALEAPMPGSVLAVKVVAGDEVQEGDVLVVVESMKMELSIVAPVSAVVREVRVAAGDQVAQGQSLVELDGALA